MVAKTSCAAGLVVLAALAPPAVADSRLSLSRGVLTFYSEDVGVANRLEVAEATRGRIRFVEPVDPFGMRFASAPCDPGRLNDQGNIVEVLCDRRPIARVIVDIGDGEDVVRYAAAAPATIYGRLGADRLRSGGGRDAVWGGQGDDVLDSGAGDDVVRGEEGGDRLVTGAGADRALPGPGADVVDAGPGDDGVQVADGDADTVACGEGYDTVLADTADTLTGCEGVSRQAVASAGRPPPEDTVAPTLRVTAPGRQRISGRRRVVEVGVATGERALVRASGYVSARGLRSRLGASSARLDAGGRTGEVVLRLSAAQARGVLADLRRGRRPHARVTLSAVDPAGNTSRPRHLTIRLVR